MTFINLHLNTISPVTFKLIVTFLIELLLVKNLQSSKNKRKVTWDKITLTVSNTSFIYIRNKIGDINKPYNTPISISLLGFLYLSMIISLFLCIRNNYIKLI